VRLGHIRAARLAHTPALVVHISGQVADSISALVAHIPGPESHTSGLADKHNTAEEAHIFDKAADNNTGNNVDGDSNPAWQTRFQH
jgi:hypothetical protein